MDRGEVTRLLAKVQAYDGRTVGDANILAWYEVLADEDFQDALKAVSLHYAERSDWIMPADIKRATRAMRLARREEKERTARLAIETGVVDRSQEIGDFIRTFRETLPPGDPRKLYTRRAYWAGEHRRWMRQQEAEPNPYYIPGQRTGEHDGVDSE